jgi:CheY-like chemotaxis protein
MSSYLLDALIVDPDIDTRMRLKTATTSVSQFKRVFLLGSLKEGLDRLGSSEPFNVMFLSYKFPQKDITDFIQSGKKTKSGEDAAYVLIVGTNSQDSSTVASSVLMGADGLLFEPYSVDNLTEITNLAVRVKKERSTHREEAALKFLINDMINTLDLLTYLKAAGHDVGRGLKRFKDMCAVLDTLGGDSKEIYMRVAQQMFEEAPLPKKLFQKAYVGASSRIKKKMEEKLLAELESGAPGDPTEKH